MMRRNFMYLRPGQLYKDFLIEEHKQEVSASGRAKSLYQIREGEILKGALADATAEQKRRWEQLGHPISHTIVQNGKPRVKAEDKLLLGERVFLIKGANDAGGLGICTIYYAEERFDVK